MTDTPVFDLINWSSPQYTYYVPFCTDKQKPKKKKKPGRGTWTRPVLVFPDAHVYSLRMAREPRFLRRVILEKLFFARLNFRLLLLFYIFYILYSLRSSLKLGDALSPSPSSPGKQLDGGHRVRAGSSPGFIEMQSQPLGPLPSHYCTSPAGSSEPRRAR